MADVGTRPLQLGILGAASRAFTSGVAPSASVKGAAIVSRDGTKAESFARECGIPRFHGSYEALLADPAIDAIYNPRHGGRQARALRKAAGDQRG